MESTLPPAAGAPSLIEYPSRFPIKVMGEKVEGFVGVVTGIARQFDPDFDAATVELRPSSGGRRAGARVLAPGAGDEQKRQSGGGGRADDRGCGGRGHSATPS